MTTYRRTPIRLSADFSTENRNSTSQKRMSSLFKVMEEKNLQPKILYPERLSLRLNREIKRQVKVKRMQHHQTSFTTNAKGTSLNRKRKRRERPTQNKLQTIKKVVRIMHDRIMPAKLLQSRQTCRPSLIAQLVKNLHAMLETPV